MKGRPRIWLLTVVLLFGIAGCTAVYIERGDSMHYGDSVDTSGPSNSVRRNRITIMP